jgi:hypothetical protein
MHKAGGIVMAWFASMLRCQVHRWRWLALLTAMLAPQTAHTAQYGIVITDGVSFSVPATLVTVPTVNPAPEINNGVNPIDVAIITDQNVASPIVGVAGHYGSGPTRHYACW